MVKISILLMIIIAFACNAVKIKSFMFLYAFCSYIKEQYYYTTWIIVHAFFTDTWGQ